MIQTTQITDTTKRPINIARQWGKRTMPSEYDQYALALNQREEKQVKIQPFCIPKRNMDWILQVIVGPKCWHNLQVKILERTFRQFLNRQLNKDNIVLHHQQAIPSQNGGEDVGNRNYLWKD